MDDYSTSEKKTLYCEHCAIHSIVAVDYNKCLNCFTEEYIRSSEYQLQCTEKLKPEIIFWCMKCGEKLDHRGKRYFSGLLHYCFKDFELTQLTLREPHYEAYSRNFKFELKYFPYTLERLCKKVINKYNIETPWPKHSWISNTT